MTSRPKFSFLYFVNVSWLMFILYFILVAQNSNASTNFQTRERKTLDEMLDPKKYDKRVRPVGVNDTGPVVVNVNFMIRAIESVSDERSEYKIQVTFRENWNDNRLAYAHSGGDSSEYLTLTDISLLWMPDTFFYNEKKAHVHNVLSPNQYIRIYPNGDVLYSTRISLTLSCPMNFVMFPFDSQNCQLKIASYGWSTRDLVYIWKEIDPVQITKNLQLQNLILKKLGTDYCHSKTNTGTYSCLRVDLTFKREFSYYLIHHYIPSCMVVIVSWVSFWLDRKVITVRIILGLITLLALSAQVSRHNEYLPKVSYTKAIDVWTGVCLTFIFFALLESASVNYLIHSNKEEEKEEELNEEKTDLKTEEKTDQTLEEHRNTSIPMDSLTSKTEDIESAETNKDECKEKKSSYKTWILTWLSKIPSKSERLDFISRILFPISFLIFIIVYCATYYFPTDDSYIGRF